MSGEVPVLTPGPSDLRSPQWSSGWRSAEASYAVPTFNVHFRPHFKDVEAERERSGERAGGPPLLCPHHSLPLPPDRILPPLLDPVLSPPVPGARLRAPHGRAASTGCSFPSNGAPASPWLTHAVYCSKVSKRETEFCRRKTVCEKWHVDYGQFKWRRAEMGNGAVSASKQKPDRA